MINVMNIRSAGHHTRAPKGRLRPAERVLVRVMRDEEGWNFRNCTTSMRRSEIDRRTAVRKAQHAAGAFAGEHEYRTALSSRRLAAAETETSWRLFATVNGSYEVVGRHPIRWDGQFTREYGFRGRRAAVRGFQHAVRFATVPGAFASRERSDY